MTLRVLLRHTFIRLLSQNASAEHNLFHPKPSKKVVRLYLDRYGQIYPSNGFKADPNIFYMRGDFCHSEYGRCRHGDAANLMTYFNYHDEDGFDEVAKAYKVSSFEGLQKKLLKEYAKTINSKLRESKSKKLVFLIHGFDNSFTYWEYIRMREKINEYTGEDDIVYVELYWDALRDQNAAYTYSRAEINSLFVGYTLRKLLANIDENINLTLLTHSIGASVATQALFNVDKWRDRYFQYYLDDIGFGLPTPKQQNITLAMLAPAIPGVQTFNDINNTSLDENDNENYKRIVVGYSEHDHVNGKGMYSIFASRYGQHALAVSRSEVHRTHKTLQKEHNDVKFLSANFTGDTKKNTHTMSQYMDLGHFSDFIDDTFGQY